MSDKQEIIILEPGERLCKEGFFSRPTSCPYCGGRGWFYSGEHEPETVPCPDCEGSGEVIAFVIIDWRPNKR